jgi:hypothetical protein
MVKIINLSSVVIPQSWMFGDAFYETTDPNIKARKASERMALSIGLRKVLNLF